MHATIYMSSFAIVWEICVVPDKCEVNVVGFSNPDCSSHNCPMHDLLLNLSLWITTLFIYSCADTISISMMSLRWPAACGVKASLAGGPPRNASESFNPGVRGILQSAGGERQSHWNEMIRWYEKLSYLRPIFANDHCIAVWSLVVWIHTHVITGSLGSFVSYWTFHIDYIFLPTPPAGSEPEPVGMMNNMDMMILDGSFLGGKGFYSHVRALMCELSSNHESRT